MERIDANQEQAAATCGVPVLLMNKVTKMIKGKAIVNQLSFEIGRGEIVGLLGPNGAGKTTTIRMMTGLIKMTEGDVLVHGHSIRNDFKQAIAHIGAIIENPEFYAHMTGLDNLLQYVRMSDGISESRINEVVELVGLQEAMNKKVKAYSLGMRQRLGIAQALLHSPKLLILDEPTNGLDPAGIREMRDYMRKIAEVEGISILISSHMLGEIEQICHRAVVIQNGTLVRATRLGAEAHTEGEVALTMRVDNIAAAQAVIQAEAGVQLTGTDELHSELNVRLYDHKVPELVAALGAAKVGIYRITEHKQSLEEDFLNWTGGNRIA
ncbi:bacitracin ABC transporter ATP-binding protein [Paenibacillus sp. FSL R7-0273]|uniref:ABC transporter ATP-binding protein n=1 Tax=Paenibacillus sp. FSL R7-0273 TaxID=1536772 RepID=UPI0004F8B15B|nr:ABC transporter ATP-binding protein [Paenibacillus sp. FSL R7-0273]AIQ46979.1 bacitracin ABC transporter ATP-binding protein [Paenibacillus sp. FSL R7-0273]OMF97260.1 bacitracin ABC transporter ATP-binding protein [Paenibacillus sp. FSL R7-0273]